MKQSKTWQKKIRLILLSVLIGLCYLGCSSGGEVNHMTMDGMSEDNFYEEAVKEDAAPEPPGSPSSPMDAPDPLQEPKAGKPEGISQKLIKTGRIELEVKDARQAYLAIKDMSEKNGGYIFEMMEDSGYDHKMAAEYKSIDLTAKVDYRKFEEMMNALSSTGEVISSSMNTQDVTRQYIDVKARIDTLLIQEKTLKELLSKATEVKDLLEIETELQRVREQIEQAQGQMNYLNDAVSYSTIHISLRMKMLPTKAAQKESIAEKLSFQFQDGLGYWGSVLIDFIGGILWLLPFLIVLIILILVLREKMKKLLVLLFAPPQKNHKKYTPPQKWELPPGKENAEEKKTEEK